MKKFLCYDTNDAASGKINVDSRGMLKPNSTVPSGSTPYQQLVTDGSGNTQWEDRLAYSFEGNVTLCQKTSLKFLSEISGAYMYKLPSAIGLLEIGKQYTVVFDETEYLLVAQYEYAIGNLSIMGAGEDTGEPFLISLAEGIVHTKTSGEHTVQITTTGTIYHKIPFEYVQNGNVIRVHDSESMTEEEAKKYSLEIGNQFFILIWGKFAFLDINMFNTSEDGKGVELLDFSNKKYHIIQNGEGLYSINDIEENSITLKIEGDRYIDSPILKIQKRDAKNNVVPITLSPASVFTTEPTEDVVLFKAENNGIKNMYDFEVLGNGTIKTRSAILPSSTPGSTKQFRITVDDTGTISATEVTS